MTPARFPQANITFVTPVDLDESQCGDIQAYRGAIKGGNVDGAPVIVTAWKPTPEELEAINRGEPIFISFMSTSLPPHMLTTSFNESVMSEESPT